MSYMICEVCGVILLHKYGFWCEDIIKWTVRLVQDRLIRIAHTV